MVLVYTGRKAAIGQVFVGGTMKIQKEEKGGLIRPKKGGVNGEWSRGTSCSVAPSAFLLVPHLSIYGVRHWT